MHVFEVVVTDLAGQTTTQELKFQMPTKVSLEKTDLWANTASLTINNIDKNAQSVSLQYRIKGETEWNTAEVVSNSDGNYTATIKPTWTSGENEAGLTIYTANNKTGLFAKKQYEYQLLVDGIVLEQNIFTPANNEGDPIFSGFSSSSSCFTTSNTSSTSWGSGNNTFASSLCTYDEVHLQHTCRQKIQALAPSS